MYSSSDDVIHAGQKYTISSPLVEECPQITNPFLDFRYLAPFWRNGQKSPKIAKFGLNVTPLQIFWGTPKILKPVLGTSFQGLLPEKFWTTP